MVKKFVEYFAISLISVIATVLVFSEEPQAPVPAAGPVTWCFEFNDGSVGKVEEYEQFIAIYNNESGQFLTAFPLEVRDSIQLTHTTFKCQ